MEEVNKQDSGDVVAGAGAAALAGICFALGVKAAEALWEQARERLKF
jgi:hypothetical protein